MHHGPDITAPLSPERLDGLFTPLGSKSGENSNDDCNLAPRSVLFKRFRSVARLQENLLIPGTSFSWFRNLEKDYLPHFSQDVELVYCPDVPGLIQIFKLQHDAKD